MKRGLLLICMVSLFVFASCGSGEPVGSNVSVDITTPSATSDVDVSSLMIATVTDPDGVGINMPSSWSDVFKLRAVGSDVNLCMSYEVTSPLTTITCVPEILQANAQYTVSISDLTDANGNRIDPSSLVFQTAAHP